MKPTILTFVRYYLPGYKSGGPVRTLANLTEVLGDEFQFKIVTTDRDLTDRSPYTNVKAMTWNRVGNADVFYCPPRHLRLLTFRRLTTETPHDVLYFNSFFDPLFTIRPLLLRALHLIPKRPVILAPRGEFSPGALAIKAWKKRAFLRTAITSLYQGLLWQASSERELELILQVMQEYTKKVLLTENIVVAPDVLPLFPDSVPKGSGFKAKGKLRVVFLSRISRMKNLDGALRSLAQVKAPVEFNIYGPLEDQTYWRQCQVLMEQLPPNVTSKYVGSVEHSRVHEVFARHHLFFFPTHGENFGHVIPESLAAGTPVLISDQTPWRGLVELGIGWDFPVSDSDRFAAIIDSVAAMDDYRYQQLRVNALRHASTGLANLEAIEKNRELFLNAARPVCRL